MANSDVYFSLWNSLYKDNTNNFCYTRPDDWVVKLEKRKSIWGEILDVGCGVGHNSLYLASKSYNVVGIDISENAIKIAKRQSTLLRLSNVDFFQEDVCNLFVFDKKFDFIIDNCCFHTLLPEDYKYYSKSLHSVCKDEAHIYLYAYEKNECDNIHGVTQDDITDSFSNEFYISSITKNIKNFNGKSRVNIFQAKLTCR